MNKITSGNAYPSIGVQDGFSSISAFEDILGLMSGADIDLDAVMAVALERIIQRGFADGCAIELIDGAELKCRWAAGSLAQEAGAARALAAARLGRWLAEIRAHGAAGGFPIDLIEDDDGAALCAVVRVAHAPAGIVRLVRGRTAFFGEQDIGRLRVIQAILDVALTRRNALDSYQILLAERTKALDDMRASEEQFRNAMSYSAIGMALVSPSGAFLTVNDAICDIVGYSAEELLALTFQDITDPDDLGRDMSLLSDLIAGGIRSYQMEKRYIRKDGAIVWVRLTVAAVRRPDGSAQHLISQIENIDKHKKNEAELQATAARLAESNHLLTLAEEMAHVGHWSVRLADGMITSSDEVLRIHGLPPGKAPSLHEVLDRFYPDRDQPRYAQAMQALAEGRAFEAEGRLVRQDGTPCHVAAIARPVQGPDGAVTGVIGVIQDITARKQAEEERELQLQQLQDSMARLKRQSADLSRMATDLAAARDAAESANRAKSEFLTAMSHELRTPLNGVLGFAQLLSGSYFGALNTKQSEFVDAILSSGNHLLELINDVLELTRIEAGNMAVTIEPTDPVAVVKSIVTTLEPMARRFLVRLRSAEREDGSTIVMADRTRLAQALLNLGSNAIKYNRPGGSVSFVVGEPVDGWTRLSVDDTGIGIPEARFPELFKPFSRLGAERKAIEGTGVGLSLTRRLVELMGGRIGFRSAPDIGSSFWIELPTVAGGGFRQTEKSTARIVSGLIG